MAASALAGPSILGADHLIHRYDGHDRIVEALECRLVARGFASEPGPLSALHRHLPEGAAELDDNYLNDVMRSFYRLDDALLAGYRRLIGTLAGMLGFDFLFQAVPILRFHPPARFPPSLRTAAGRGSQFHSDILGGHPVRMINAWLALTPTAGTNALHLAPLADSVAVLEHFAANSCAHDGLAGTLLDFYAAQRDDPAFALAVASACTPVPMTPGDLVLFDARCIHGGTENREATTRVSLDFRLVPLPVDAAAVEAEIAAAHPRWVRGDILHERSARELLGAG